MKTSELTGRALDYAVMKALQPGFEDWRLTAKVEQEGFHPSVNWAHGGPIIEQEMIELRWTSGAQWWARIWVDEDVAGPTPLIAAMRCYIAGKFGDEIDIPEHLQASTEVC